MRKVLLVGGEDIHLRLSMIHELMELGYKVAVAGPVLHPSLAAEKITFFMYDLYRGIGLSSDLRAIYGLRKILKDWAPDIVHAFDTKPTFLTPIAAAGIRKPIVIRTVNGMGKIFSSDSWKMSILRVVHWLVHRSVRHRVDHTIFQNSSDQCYFFKHHLVKSKEFSLVPGSGIDVSLLNGFRTPQGRQKYRKTLGLEKSTVFVMVARLVAQKGVLEYLEAAKQLRNKHSEAKFLLVGPGGADEPDGISSKIIQSYSADVSYLGRRSDVPNILVASDVFVLPTKYREGVPRAMLEAMALSLPVIVSDVPGCRDAVQNTKSGWVIPAGDVEKLKEAMEDALGADLKQIGQFGSEAINEIYALDIVLKSLAGVYEACWRKKNGI